MDLRCFIRLLPDHLEKYAKSWQSAFIIVDRALDNFRKLFLRIILYAVNDGLAKIDRLQWALPPEE